MYMFVLYCFAVYVHEINESIWQSSVSHLKELLKLYRKRFSDSSKAA
jgi:hypothetical protein